MKIYMAYKYSDIDIGWGFGFKIGYCFGEDVKSAKKSISQSTGYEEFMIGLMEVKNPESEFLKIEKEIQERLEFRNQIIRAIAKQKEGVLK